MQNEKITFEEGQLLIDLARKKILSYLKGDDFQIDIELPKIFYDRFGVFVTLNLNSNLRGCIGYPEPIMPLIDGLLDVSIAAAFEDYRFNPLTLEEYEKINVEVSVLTKPELIEVTYYQEYLDKIELGVDGLTIDDGFHRGLFLPQVPIEQGWDTLSYLENLCYKAGLNKDAWKDETSKLYRFQSQIFNEK